MTNQSEVDVAKARAAEDLKKLDEGADLFFQTALGSMTEDEFIANWSLAVENTIRKEMSK